MHKFLKIILGWLAAKIQSCRLEYLRYDNEKRVAHLGAGSTISGLVSIVYPENVFIGTNTYINGGMLCASSSAIISIGNDCLISYGIHIRTDMHKYLLKNDLIREQGHADKDVIIGNDVWIGFGVQIMAGVIIADGCVIGAGAVVTHNTVPYGVYGGVPATLIKMRE